jgi:hypothetical protein
MFLVFPARPVLDRFLGNSDRDAASWFRSYEQMIRSSFCQLSLTWDALPSLTWDALPFCWKLHQQCRSLASTVAQPCCLLFSGCTINVVVSLIYFSLVTIHLIIIPTQSQSQCYFMTGSLPPVSLSWQQVPWASWPPFFFNLNTCFHSPYVTPLWWEDGYVVYNCCWPLPAQSFLGPSPLGLVTIFFLLFLVQP